MRTLTHKYGSQLIYTPRGYKNYLRRDPAKWMNTVSLDQTQKGKPKENHSSRSYFNNLQCSFNFKGALCMGPVWTQGSVVDCLFPFLCKISAVTCSVTHLHHNQASWPSIVTQGIMAPGQERSRKDRTAPDLVFSDRGHTRAFLDEETLKSSSLIVFPRE